MLMTILLHSVESRKEREIGKAWEGVMDRNSIFNV